MKSEAVVYQRPVVWLSAALLAVIMTVMEMTALPAALFLKIEAADIDPMYLTLMANFLLAGLLCLLWRYTLGRTWRFGLQWAGTGEALRKHGLPALAATGIVAAAFCIGLAPFDNKPTFWRVLVEGFVYYIGVGIMEELYLRGLLQNLLAGCFAGRRHASLWAVLITSALFGLGHIVGCIGQPLLTGVCKVLWAAALGVYFGAVYVRTRNLTAVMLLHALIDFCGVPFCFSTSNQYPPIALAACVGCFGLLLGGYGLALLRQEDSPA